MKLIYILIKHNLNALVGFLHCMKNEVEPLAN